MGLYLSSPCREVDAEEGTGNHLQYAVGEMQVSSSPFWSELSYHLNFFATKSHLHLFSLDLAIASQYVPFYLHRQHSNINRRQIKIFECARNPTISTSIVLDNAITPHLVS